MGLVDTYIGIGQRGSVIRFTGPFLLSRYIHIGRKEYLRNIKESPPLSIFMFLI